MKFKFEMEFDTEFDVDDKFSLSRKQVEELMREFQIMKENCGFLDFVEEKENDK